MTGKREGRRNWGQKVKKKGKKIVCVYLYLKLYIYIYNRFSRLENKPLE